MLEEIKILLGLDPLDKGQDDRLLLIISGVRQQLRLLLGGAEPPQALDHVVREAAISRFNRIGSEGMTGHIVEGESQQFAKGDFAGLEGEIQAFLDSESGGAKGRVRFL